MTRFVLALSAASMLLLAVPVDAEAHCGSCGVGEAHEAAEAPCDCANGGEDCGCAEGECDCAAEQAADEASAGEAAEEGEAVACAFCAGDAEAECTCDHGHE